MRIVIAGGTGFLGSALARRLPQLGHTVLVLTRRAHSAAPHHIAWTPDGSAGAWAASVDGADALINLAGAGLADARWSDARKSMLRSSRLLATRSLTAAVRQASQPPAVFLSASGVGYYGHRGDEVVTEQTPAGADFLATLCLEWEREAEHASTKTRVVCLRNGLVLDPSGGALQRMLLPFRLGVGGRLGTGRQYLPWIHLQDWVNLIVWLVGTSGASGAFNVTAPSPITNREFTRALGQALHRPAIIPIPAVALRAALGELADTLLTGQRAVPARATDMGFTFEFPEIAPAVRDLLDERGV